MQSFPFLEIIQQILSLVICLMDFELLSFFSLVTLPTTDAADTAIQDYPSLNLIQTLKICSVPFSENSFPVSRKIAVINIVVCVCVCKCDDDDDGGLV